MDYYQKYLKYKEKYLKLKIEVRGGNDGDDCGKYDVNTHFCSRELKTGEDDISHYIPSIKEKLEKGGRCFDDHWCKSNKCVKGQRQSTCQ